MRRRDLYIQPMLSEHDIQRYSRQLLLDEIGPEGQARLRRARVLVVGAGGLGSPLILYLAGAGLGAIGIADGDHVELSNLHRQIAHGAADLGRNKAQSAAAAARRIDPRLAIEVLPAHVAADGIDALVARYDIVCDGTDNFAARRLVAEACFRHARPLISAAVLRHEGQLAVFLPGGPCYACLYPEMPRAGTVPNCAEAGVLGPVTGALGAMQALETIRLAAGTLPALAGRLMLWDAVTMQSHIMALKRDPGCALCGKARQSPDHSGAGVAHGEPA